MCVGGVDCACVCMHARCCIMTEAEVLVTQHVGVCGYEVCAHFHLAFCKEKY